MGVEGFGDAQADKSIREENQAGVEASPLKTKLGISGDTTRDILYNPCEQQVNNALSELFEKSWQELRALVAQETTSAEWGDAP